MRSKMACACALMPGPPRRITNTALGWAVSQGDVVDYPYAGGLGIPTWSIGLLEKNERCHSSRSLTYTARQIVCYGALTCLNIKNILPSCELKWWITTSAMNGLSDFDKCGMNSAQTKQKISQQFCMPVYEKFHSSLKKLIPILFYIW